MKNLKHQSFILEFDPVGWTGKGQYLIKVDNEVRTPFANVFVGFMGESDEARKKAKEHARIRAERIVKALNHCKGMDL